MAQSQVLHEATLKLLDRVGVAVESELARELFASHGVRVNKRNQRVHVTDEDVQRALQTAPKSWAVYGRSADTPMVIGGDEVYTLSGGASLRVLGLDGRYEPSTWEHLRQFNTLIDGLPNIHMLINQVDPPDLGGRYYQKLAAEMLLGTSKPVCLQAGSAADIEAYVQMGIAIRGSREELEKRPIWFTGTNGEPPLRISKQGAEIQIAASKAGILCGVGDYVMMGITAPITVAGALVQRNAVQLTALVLSQCARPGAPFKYIAASGSADMRTLDPVMANPHALRVLRESVALGKFYGLPIVSLAPTDAKMADAQAAVERVASFMQVMDAGAHLIQGPTSMMDQMMLSSLTQAVIDDEVVGYALAARRELSVTDDELALGVIEDVVRDPAYGDLKFAMHAHTLSHVREDAWQGSVFSSETFNAWQAAGARTLLERADDRCRDILSEHQVEPMPEMIAREVRRISGE